MPIRKRDPPVRARIPHRKRPPLRSPPQNQRHLQQHRRNQLIAANLRTPHGRIPKIPQKSGIRFRRRLFSRRSIPVQNCPHPFSHNLFVRARLQPCHPFIQLAQCSANALHTGGRQNCISCRSSCLQYCCKHGSPGNLSTFDPELLRSPRPCLELIRAVRVLPEIPKSARHAARLGRILPLQLSRFHLVQLGVSPTPGATRLAVPRAKPSWRFSGFAAPKWVPALVGPIFYLLRRTLTALVRLSPYEFGLVQM